MELEKQQEEEEETSDDPFESCDEDSSNDEIHAAASLQKNQAYCHQAC